MSTPGEQAETGDAEELERRHQALIARDHEVGLMAEAETARAHAARVQADLDVARERLARKNARIKQLVARVAELEAGSSTEPGRASMLRRSVRRVVRR